MTNRARILVRWFSGMILVIAGSAWVYRNAPPRGSTDDYLVKAALVLLFVGWPILVGLTPCVRCGRALGWRAALDRFPGNTRRPHCGLQASEQPGAQGR